MFIPLIPKNPDLNDLTCRDGEIDFIIHMEDGQNDSQSAGQGEQEIVGSDKANIQTNNLSLIIKYVFKLKV